jgi:hypothetical protein
MHEYMVSLRIVGEDLDTAEVSKTLSVPPTRVIEIGDPLKTAVATKAVWIFEAFPSGGKKWTSLEDALVTVLSVFSGSHERIRELQGKFDVCLFCGHFSSSFDGGPVFSPTLLRMLGEFGVEMFLDTYFSDSE